MKLGQLILMATNKLAHIDHRNFVGLINRNLIKFIFRSNIPGWDVLQVLGSKCLHVLNWKRTTKGSSSIIWERRVNISHRAYVFGLIRIGRREGVASGDLGY